MKSCPACKDGSLSEASLEDDVPAQSCDACQGIWLSAGPYEAWLEAHASPGTEKADSEIPAPTGDTQKPKLCPDCERIMLRYRVLPGASFYVEHCGHCNGVWFDRDEWGFLAARNLHRRVNSFFTDTWQRHIREEENRAALDRLYLERFGAADYDRLKDVAAWLKDRSERSTMLAFLLAEDPYKL